MCGIAGYVSSVDSFHSQNFHVINSMLDVIKHRGPDDQGVWASSESAVVLGHRRLSVVDITRNGHQPMISSCGRYVLIFNGEIYNFLDIKNSLSGVFSWRGNSDTEVLLASISEKGVAKTLESLVGMFSFVLWDCLDKSLTLARDRVGEKPLYYGWQKETFIFSSELGSLEKHPSFSSEISLTALGEFFRWNYIPGPMSIYNNIFKLPPATYLTLRMQDITNRQLVKPVSYWSLRQSASRGKENSFNGSLAEAVDELERLLKVSVTQQSIADVPIGAFLSGGIDSSAVVAMMKASGSSCVKTFSIGMPADELDESRYASVVAKHLGTVHFEHIITPREAIETIPLLAEMWGEPFADSSQIPTYLVSKLAKQQVTVALSGDGGDELFLGYGHHRFTQRVWAWRYLRLLPLLRASKALDFIANGHRSRLIASRLRSASEAWRASCPSELNRYWHDHYRSQPVPLKHVYQDDLNPLANLENLSPAELAALDDAENYLPDDILVKVDRASMANSLEVRCPLLDHRVIEFSFRLPAQYKLRGGVGKHVLRELLYRYVPRELVDRPKMGFSIPLASWLRSELRPWVENTLDEIPMDSEVIDKKLIDLMWKQHVAGSNDHSQRLWGILMASKFIRKL